MSEFATMFCIILVLIEDGFIWLIINSKYFCCYTGHQKPAIAPLSPMKPLFWKKIQINESQKQTTETRFLIIIIIDLSFAMFRQFSFSCLVITVTH